MTANVSYDAEDDQLSAISKTELYIMSVLLLTLSVVGTTGNALVLYVFSSKQDGLVSTLFITVLAVVDLTTCLFIVPFTVAMEHVDFSVSSDFVCKLYQFLITSNIPFSALVMAAIAVDRYLCICRPFCRVLNVARARWVVVALALSAGGLGLGGSLTHGIYQRQQVQAVDDNETSSLSFYPDNVDESDHRSGLTTASNIGAEELGRKGEWTVVNTGLCDPNDILISEEIRMGFQKCYNGVFLSCLLVVCVLYALIYRSVRQRRLWREKHKKIAIVTTAASSVHESQPQLKSHKTNSNRKTTSVMQFLAKKNDKLASATGSDRRAERSTAKNGDDCNNTVNSMTCGNTKAGESGADGSSCSVNKSCRSTFELTSRTSVAETTAKVDSTESSDVHVLMTVSKPAAVVIPAVTTEQDASWSSGTTGPATTIETVDLSTSDVKTTSTIVASRATSSAGTAATTSLAAAQKNRIANVKTAAMLFVVTVVFVLTFMPALSMTVALIPYNTTVFYMYFANNVANPIIYSFMNQNFRKQLRRLFSSSRHQ